MSCAFRLLAGISALVLASCTERAPAPAPGPVVDWTRYLGTWYELARFDHRFERGLVAVTADYFRASDGALRVVNAGRRETLDGPLKSASASAKVTGPATLSVTFFWPFSGEYRVLALADDYRWAVVGSSTKSYLWFLHRAPLAPTADWTAMQESARSFGYDLSGLIRVPQPSRQ